MSNETFSELRSLLQSAPSSAAWAQITALLDAHPDDDLLRDHLLPYVISSLRRWPDAIAPAPQRWIEDLMEGRDNPRITAARSLSLLYANHNHLAHRGIAALANSPYVTGLRDLTLQSVPLSAQGAAMLSNTSQLDGLRHVHIKAYKLTAESLHYMTGARWLPNLMSLGLEYATLDEPRARRLIEHLDHAPLRLLHLDNSRVPTALAFALATSPLPATIEALHLSGAELLAQGAYALATAPFQRLRVLYLAGARVGDEGVESLLAAPWMEQVTHLDLAYNKLSLRAARAIAQAPALSSLRELSLYGNHIGDDGAAALAQSPHLRQLDTLRLELNEITRTGGQALATSQTLPQHLRDHWRALYP